jgi:hypothetical protein
MEFHHPKDTVLIAYSYPYTLTDYKHHLQQILDRPRSDSLIKRFKMCSTLAGEDCDLVVITDFGDGREKIGPLTFTEAEYQSCDETAPSVAAAGTTQVKLKAKELKALEKQRQSLKPALFLSARVHPGETPASWMMKGIMDFLTSDSPAAQQIRKLYVVFIVPILNPDGVVFGNNRCALAGVDLNRQWKLPVRHLHPTIYYFKMFMLAQKKLREVSMYVDLHGHSRKYNVFMYGCDDKKKPKPQVRAFPKFLSNHHIGGKYVCFNDCSFHVKKGRESTARVVVSKEMNIPCSFTLEATFCGSNYGPLKNCHMNIGHMQEVGAALCDAFLNFAISEGFGKECLALASSSKNYLTTYAVESGGSAMTSIMADLTMAASSNTTHHHSKRRGTSGSFSSQVPAGDDSAATGNTGDDFSSIAGGDDRSSRRGSGVVSNTPGIGRDDNETGAEAAGQNPNIVESDSEDSDNDESRTPPVPNSRDAVSGNQLEVGGSGHNVRPYVSGTTNGIAVLKSGVAATGHALLMQQHHHFPGHSNPQSSANLTSVLGGSIAAANQPRTTSDSRNSSQSNLTGLTVSKTGRTEIIPLSGLASITTSAPNSANSGGVQSARSTTALSDAGSGSGIISSRSNPSPQHFQNSSSHSYNTGSHHNPSRLLSSSVNLANMNGTTPIPTHGSNSSLLQTLKNSSTAISNSARDYGKVDGEDKGLDRVMELMYSSSYRDSAKLRAADGLSSASGSRSGKMSSSSGRSGLAASALELTGNKYHGGNVTTAMLGLNGQYSTGGSLGSVSPIPHGSSPRTGHVGLDSSSFSLAGSGGLGSRYQRSVTLDNSGIATTSAAAAAVAAATNYRSSSQSAGAHSSADGSSSTTLPKLNVR